MKYIILSLVLCAFIFGCNDGYVKNGKHVYPKYRPLLSKYYDSVEKYYVIKSECGNELYKYYSAKYDSAYKLVYPEGNPSAEADKKFDTVCYPIK
ncbi:MAG TPA: hypothetical protein PLX17_00470 [Chitinophagaceae bacterium]|nr:hypothetical protein [Chitinophagaceae bacterium]